MERAVLQIFERLTSPEESAQQYSVAELAILLERAMKRPEADEEFCASVLTEDVLALRLSAPEIEEVLSKAVDYLNSEALRRSTKMSLFWVVMKMGSLTHADAVLQFFSDRAHTFTEQEAFSSIAGLTIFAMKCERDGSGFRALVAEHGTIGFLETFQRHPSARVREATLRTLGSFRN